MALLFLKIWIFSCCQYQQKLLMSENPVSSDPPKVENLNFQLILINYTPHNNMIEAGGSLKLSINRGKQTFEETKNIAMQLNEGVIPFNRTKLNFMLFSYDHTKNYEFNLKLNHILMGEQKCLGQYPIDCNAYAQTFLKNGNGAFQEILYMNEKQKIEVELYVEKNRYALQKLVREMTNPKTRSNIQVEPHSYQRINQGKFRFGRQLSLSPKRQRENPFKRNSPKKENQEEAISSARKEEIAIQPEINIKSSISHASLKQQMSKHNSIIQEQTLKKKQDQVVVSEKINEPIKFNTPQKNEKPTQQVLVEAEAPVALQPAKQVQLSIQDPVALQTVEPIKEQTESPIAYKQSAKQAQVIAQAPVVCLQLEQPIKEKATLEERKEEFRIDHAIEIIKNQLQSHKNSLPVQQTIFLNQKVVMKHTQDADKPTLHTINQQSAHVQHQEIQQTLKPYQGNEQKLSAENIPQNTQKVKRVNIFREMSLKLKIFLAVLVIFFLFASNHIEEQDSIESIQVIDAPILNITVSASQQIEKKKTTKKSSIKPKASKKQKSK